MKIAIIGGGFAGIKAANVLGKKLGTQHEILLFDKNDYTTMLPNIPEVAGGRLQAKDITEKIQNLIPKSVTFIQTTIEEVNFDDKKVVTAGGNYSYDYMVFAAGSTTNFYDFNENLELVHVLDSLDSALQIKEDFINYVAKTEEPVLTVSGAGYTGIELACNLYDYTKKQGKKLKVNFIEIAPRVLPMLNEKLSDHVLQTLEDLRFEVFTDNKIVGYDGESIKLKNGEIIENTFFCWCSGVKNSIVPVGNYEALFDGRIIVDEFLRIPNYPEVYAVGDAAAMKDTKGNFLRRGVNYAQMAASRGAKNLVAAIVGSDQKEFKAIDLGWVIPIYVSSVGESMGLKIKGRIGIFMHFTICGVKNYNIKNFIKAVKSAIIFPFSRA